MSRSVFLGGDPSAAWSDEDRAWALAFLALERETCDCGQPVTESFDPANEDAYTTEWLRCHACAARDRADKALPDSADRAGLRISVTRREAR